MSRHLLQSVMHLLPGGISVLDANGSVVAANDDFARSTGRHGEILGLSLFSDFDVKPADAMKLYREAMARGTVEFRIEISVAGSAEETRVVRLDSFEFEGAMNVLARIEGSDGELDLLRRDLASARHSVNNVLMGLIGHAELLLDTPELPGSLRGRAESIMEQTRKISAGLDRLHAIIKARPPD